MYASPQNYSMCVFIILVLPSEFLLWFRININSSTFLHIEPIKLTICNQKYPLKFLEILFYKKVSRHFSQSFASSFTTLVANKSSSAETLVIMSQSYSELSSSLCHIIGKDAVISYNNVWKNITQANTEIYSRELSSQDKKVYQFRVKIYCTKQGSWKLTGAPLFLWDYVLVFSTLNREVSWTYIQSWGICCTR